MRRKDMGDAIVITGVGLACSLGIEVDRVWEGIVAGQSRAGAMPALESQPQGGANGYQAMDLPPEFFPRLQREARYLRWVFEAACRQSQSQSLFAAPHHRMGVVLGTTLHGMRCAGKFFRSGMAEDLRGFQASSVLGEALDGTDFKADAVTTCSACSSSLGAVALGVTLLETRQLDVVVVGGYDAVSEYAYGGFNSLRLVADGPLRPFARDRQGMKLGEGYGLLVLERERDAVARGARMLARIRGFGESADAHHLTQPHPEGQGAAAAIAAALRRGGLEPRHIDLVAAHATGTPDNDAGEHAALSRIFGQALPTISVVAFKSHIGHTLGGAGAVELILSLMALRHQILPPCLNVGADEVEFADMALAMPPARPAKLRAALNLSLGFGGANTCVILERADPAMQNTRAVQRSVQAVGHSKDGSAGVFITGIGVVLPGAIGNEAMVQRLALPSPPATGAINESDFIHLLNARRVRRLSDYVKLTLAAATLACRDAGVEDNTEFRQSCSAVLGTAHGSSSYCQAYYGQIVKEGMAAANPMLFAEGVPNAAAAHLSMMLDLRGSCQTLIGSRTTGLDALRLASLRIGQGQWDRAIVSAAEEFVPQVNETYAHFGLYNDKSELRPFGDERGFAASAGAVTFVLESEASARARHARVYAKVAASAAVRYDPARAGLGLARLLHDLGGGEVVIGSANNTRVDRLESGVLARMKRPVVYSSLYGHWPELFSVTQPAAIAAALLSGRLPRLLNQSALPDVVAPAGAEQHFSSGTFICTGFGGSAVGVRIEAI